MKRSEMPDWAWILPRECDEEVVEYRYKSSAGTHHGYHWKWMHNHDHTLAFLHPGFKDGDP